MLRRIDAESLAYEPGHGWGYSNVGYLFVRDLIETAIGLPLGPALQHLAFTPFGISGVGVAREPADLDATAWGKARRYDPTWVYHGLLVGTPSASALFLHRLLAGDLLFPDLLDALQDGHLIGGAMTGRPWTIARYGLGLMMGEGEPPGEYVGHTGGGPGITSAVYRNSTRGTTGAASARGNDPGLVEAQLCSSAPTFKLTMLASLKQVRTPTRGFPVGSIRPKATLMLAYERAIICGPLIAEVGESLLQLLIARTRNSAGPAAATASSTASHRSSFPTAPGVLG